jgi:hypothetical protein
MESGFIGAFLITRDQTRDAGRLDGMIYLWLLFVLSFRRLGAGFAGLHFHSDGDRCFWACHDVGLIIGLMYEIHGCGASGLGDNRDVCSSGVIIYVAGMTLHQY